MTAFVGTTSGRRISRGKSSGTKLEFELQATGAGTPSAIISQATTGVPWSYTSN
jgi:hypothetical protein